MLYKSSYPSSSQGARAALILCGEGKHFPHTKKGQTTGGAFAAFFNKVQSNLRFDTVVGPFFVKGKELRIGRKNNKR